MSDREIPLVSVCVQTYQHGRYIEECLDSILMQRTNFAFEIILGEDESTDGTREICLSYAKKYPNIIQLILRSRKDVILINGKASGRGNMLENMRRARGKYIAFLEGDDYWTDPEKLQFQVDFMEKHPECFMINHALPEAKKNTLEGWYDLERLYKFGYLPHTSNFLFRKFDMGKYKKPLRYMIGGETCLLYIAASEGLIYHSSRVVSAYRLNPKGIHISQSKGDRIITQIKQNDQLFKYFKLDRQIFLRRKLYLYRQAKANHLNVGIYISFYRIIETIFSYYKAATRRFLT